MDLLFFAAASREWPASESDSGFPHNLVSFWKGFPSFFRLYTWRCSHVQLLSWNPPWASHVFGFLGEALQAAKPTTEARRFACWRAEFGAVRLAAALCSQIVPIQWRSMGLHVPGLRPNDRVSPPC